MTLPTTGTHGPQWWQGMQNVELWLHQLLCVALQLLRWLSLTGLETACTKASAIVRIHDTLLSQIQTLSSKQQPCNPPDGLVLRTTRDETMAARASHDGH